MSRKSPLLLGAHIPILSGLAQAIKTGESIGCTTIQLFTKNNRQWHSKPLDQSTVEKFRQTVATSSIKKEHIVAHASYLINLASPNHDVRTKSSAALTDEYERCHALEIPYLVLHPGARLDSPVQTACAQIACELEKILSHVNSSTMILLETMAGQGSTIGSTFEELALIINTLSPVFSKRVGICVDTCHLFAAGYQFQEKKDYDALFEHFDNIIGLEKLKVFHINDSKKEFNCHVDRHEDIGKGQIGLDAFRFILNDTRFASIPKILETPKESEADDLRNLNTLRELA